MRHFFKNKTKQSNNLTKTVRQIINCVTRKKKVKSGNDLFIKENGQVVTHPIYLKHIY